MEEQFETGSNYESPRITWPAPAAILISIGIFLIYSGIQLVVVGIIATLQIMDAQGNMAEELPLTVIDLATNGDALAITGIASALFGIITVYLFARLKKGNNFKLQLGFIKPKLIPTLMWIFISIGVALVLELIGREFGLFETDFMRDIYASTTNYTALFFAVAIFGPIFEELLFRGFFLEALTRTALGSHGAVLVSSLVFATVHVQYDFSIMAAIVLLGMILGYSRLHTRSLLAPCLIHIINNASAFLLTAYELG